MSISQFTAALKSKSNAAVTAQATQMLQELLRGSSEQFDLKNPLSIKSGASILSVGTIQVPYKGSDITKEFKDVNLTEVFRAEGEKQGSTALLITASDLEILFRRLNVVRTTEDPLILLYVKYLLNNYGSSYKAKHFEIYVDDGSSDTLTMLSSKSFGQKKLSDILGESTTGIQDVRTKKDINIRAIRGLNFSHVNALTHLASFIHYFKTGVVITGKSQLLLPQEAEISALFQRGHIIAQSTSRAEISTKYVSSIKNNVGEETNPILLMTQLARKLDEVSSGLTSYDAEIMASIDKDLSRSRPRMTIRLELTSDMSSGTDRGNKAMGDLNTSLALVGTLQRMLSNLSKAQTRAQKKASTVSFEVAPAIATTDKVVKELEGFLNKLSKNQGALYNKLAAILGPDSTSKGGFLVNLQSSDSIRDYITNDILSILNTNKNTPAVRVSSSKVKIASNTASTKITKVAPKIKALTDTFKSNINRATAAAKTPIKAREVKLKQAAIALKTTNLVQLQNLINQNLAKQIQSNMGTGNSTKVLNYRTGRLAESAKVEAMSESRQNMITAFYSYMRNPYGTFAEGGAQEFPVSRNPKLLIAQSIRQLAGTQVANRMRAVLV